MNDEAFGDVEKVLYDYLGAALDPVRVSTVVPNPRPSTFVTVQRIGGPRNGQVTEVATVAVECWDKRDKGAHDLAQQARSLVHQLAGTQQGGMMIYRVQEFAGPARLPDPTSTQPRFTFTVAMTVRCTTP